MGVWRGYFVIVALAICCLYACCLDCLLNDVLFWGFGDACWLFDLIVVLCYLVVGDGFDGCGFNSVDTC